MKRYGNLAWLATFLAVLFIIGIGVAQAAEELKIKGQIPFDFPNPPEAKIEMNLNGKLLSLFAKSAKPEPKITELIAMVEGIQIRGYAGDIDNRDQIIRHYENKLKKEKWEVIAKVKEKNETVQVRLLFDEEMVRGLFVMVSGTDETIMVNIFGHIDFEKVGELLGNLDVMNLNLDLDWAKLEKLEIDTEARHKAKSK